MPGEWTPGRRPFGSRGAFFWNPVWVDAIPLHCIHRNALYYAYTVSWTELVPLAGSTSSSNWLGGAYNNRQACRAQMHRFSSVYTQMD